MNNQYIQNQNVFEKNVMCKNLYSSQSNYLKEHYDFNYDWMERRVSSVETFYSKYLDTCVVAYQIHFRDNKNSLDNDDNYLLEDIKGWAENHYWLIMACHSDEKDCFSKRDKKKSELK